MALAVLTFGRHGTLTSTGRVLKRADSSRVSELAELARQLRTAVEEELKVTIRSIEQAHVAQLQAMRQEADRRTAARLLELERDFALTRDRLLDRFQDVVDEVARVLIGERLSAAYLKQIIHHAREILGADEVMELRVCMADKEAAEAAAACLSSDGSITVKVVADSALKSTQCIVKTRAGAIDGSVDAQLGAIRDAVARWQAGDGEPGTA